MAQSQTEKDLATIKGTLQEQDNAIFGSWDPAMRVRSPGILERLDALTCDLKTLTKIVFWGLAPITALYTLTSLGVPLKDTIPELLKIIVACVSH